MRIRIGRGVILTIEDDNVEIGLQDIEQIQEILAVRPETPTLAMTTPKTTSPDYEPKKRTPQKKRVRKTRKTRQKRRYDQDKVYHVVLELIKKYGVSPSSQEICTTLGARTKSKKAAVHVHLNQLNKKGRIKQKGKHGHMRYDIILKERMKKN